MRLSQRIKKPRFAFIYPVGLFAVLFLNSTDTSLLIGTIFIVAGFMIRGWANGYAIKMNMLTTSGPYAFVRHPLYIGTTIIAIGFAIIFNSSYLGIAFIIMLAAIYYRTIRKEEKDLEAKFQQEYLDYKRSVPSILPRVSPYRKGQKWVFSLERLIRSKEHKAALGCIMLIIIVHIKEEFIVEREQIDAQIWYLIICVIVFGIIELIEAAARRKVATAGKGN